MFYQKSKKVAIITLITATILFVLYNIFVNGNTVLALSKYG